MVSCKIGIVLVYWSFKTNVQKFNRKSGILWLMWEMEIYNGSKVTCLTDDSM